MWTSNSGPPFNQPSKSSTKWAFVRYRPGPVGGGGGSHTPAQDRQSMAAGVVEKSVSTGTTAITGVAGGRSGSRTSRLPCTSNATGGAWSAGAVAASTLASPFPGPRGAPARGGRLPGGGGPRPRAAPLRPPARAGGPAGGARGAGGGRGGRGGRGGGRPLRGWGGAGEGGVTCGGGGPPGRGAARPGGGRRGGAGGPPPRGFSPPVRERRRTWK